MSRSNGNWWIERLGLWKLVFLLAAVFASTIRPLTAAETLPLAGEWRFALDRNDTGTNQSWFAKNLPDRIQLPGILEAQGYGDEISTQTPWVLSLYDHFWFLRADYAADTNAGSVKVPFLCQPLRHYLGTAWYQRDFDLPADWKNRRIVLFLERPRWKSTVWLDDREIGSDISLCTPHEYDFGLVATGRHRLTIRLDNRMILPYRPDAHSVSDSLDNAWNGIVGKIELRATPPVWIDDVQVYPNAATHSITVKGTLGNDTRRTVTNLLVLKIISNAAGGGGKPQTLSVVSSSRWTTFETEVSSTYPVKTWDEFNPQLYELTVTNRSADVSGQTEGENRNVTFGFRDLHTEGSQFILNGRPVFLRGTHFGGDFPLTGYPPTDVDSWRKIFLTCKSYGLNHMRFHSWCPPEAAFEAADETGVYLQIECGMWNEITGGAMENMLYAETDRIIKSYGNHPSFMLLSASNEAHGRWQEVLPQWVKHFRGEDGRRLYTPDTGWALIDSPGQPLNGGADYLAVGRIGSGRVRGEGGWFGRDFGDSIAGVNAPVVAHEVGQWVAYPDFDVIRKFTGFMQPGNFEIFRDSAAAHGLLAQNRDFARASGRFLLACYKEEIEANLRTPGLAGFQLLDLHDYTGQGTALVGVLDPFWQSKGYTTPEEFREFCAPVVPLARLTQRVFTTANKLETDVEAANFGPEPLTNAITDWRILDASSNTVSEGHFATTNIAIGKNIALGHLSTDLSKFTAPGAYSLAIEITPSLVDGTRPPHNAWNFWVYPAAISDSTPPDVLVTRSWAEATAALAAGGRVLFQPRLADLDWSSPPLARVPVFWNALMGPTWSRMLGLWCDVQHPALAEFPTEANCDWQWAELVRNARAVNLDRLPRGLTPIVSAIDDWNRNYKLGVIFEAKVGNGKLLVCTIELDARPGAQQLRRSLLDYMAGGQFQPQTEISTDDFTSLHFDTRIMHHLAATATADDRDAHELVDGDPNTFWSSANPRGKGPAHPHTIVVRFKNPVAMTGLVLMPRQNEREHQGDIRDYAIESSDDGTHWQPVVSGQLASTFDPQTVRFGKTISAREIRLIARSGFGRDDSASLAELAVMYAGPKLVDSDSGRLEYQPVRTASPDIDAGDVPGKPGK